MHQLRPAARPLTARPRAAHHLLALGALALLPGLIAGCVPDPGPPDGYAAPADELPAVRAELAVDAQFVWPDGTSRATADGVVLSDASLLPLQVRIRNIGRRAVAVHLDDLVMRPVSGPDEEDDVEAVFAAPGALRLQPGQVRVLDFGQVSLFFGFACTVHLTGELIDADRSDTRVAISHDSPPILRRF